MENPKKQGKLCVLCSVEVFDPVHPVYTTHQL